MFKCPQCGAKNEPGALFCRSCGKKLDMANLEQQLEDQQSGLRGVDWKRIGRIVRRIVGLVLLLSIIGVGIGIFLPVDARVPASIPEREEQEAYAKLESILQSEVDTYTFTSAEVTALANRLLGLGEAAAATENEEEGGFALKPQQLQIELLASGYVRMVLHSTTFKGMSVYSTVIGRFEVRAERVDFLPHSAYCGKVRMIGPLKGVIQGRFTSLIEGDQLMEALRKRIDFVSVSRGEVDIDVEAD